MLLGWAKYVFTVCFVLLLFQTFALSGLKDTVRLQEVSVNQWNSLNRFIDSNNSLPILSNKGSSLVEALQESSSIYLKNYGAGQLSSISVRGTSASQSDVLWNGIQLHSPMLGQVDLSLFTVGFHDNVSLNANSSKGNIGGSLNLLNSVPDSGVRFDANIGYGSFNTFHSYFDSHYSNGKVGGSSGFNYQRSDNNFSYPNEFVSGNPTVQQQHGEVKLFSFFQQLFYTVNKHQQLSAYFWFSDADRNLPQLPGQPDNRENQQDRSYRALAKWEANYNRWSLAYTGAYLNDWLRYVSIGAGIDAASRSETWRNVLAFAYRINRSFRLQSQVNYDHESAFTADYGTPKSRNTEAINVELYVEHKQLFGKAGLRESLIDKGFSPILPSLQVGYSIRKREKHRLLLSILLQRSYRSPTLNDLYWQSLGNPNLQPEKAWKGEWNVDYSFRNALHLNFTNYYLYATDWILWYPQSNGLWTPGNVTKVYSRGVEASAEYNLHFSGFSVRLRGAYSFTKTTNLSPVSGNEQSNNKQLIYVPLHSVNVSINLAYKRFYLKATNHYFSERFTTSDNSESLHPYYLLNLEAGKEFRFNKQLIALALKLNNVTNTTYQAVVQRPMPGRGWDTIVRFEF